MNAIYGLTYTDLALGENDKAAQVVSQGGVEPDVGRDVLRGGGVLAQCLHVVDRLRGFGGHAASDREPAHDPGLEDGPAEVEV